MKKNQKLLILIVLITMSVFSSCKKEIQIQQINSTTEIKNYKESAGVASVLGQKIENAYTIENFMAAYKEMISKESTSRLSQNNQLSLMPTPSQIAQLLVANTKYVRVLPRNEDEYTALRDQYPDKVFSDFPLDYEDSIGGNYYHDPSLPDSQITWQYIVLKNTENIASNFQQQTLQTNIFLPENSPAFNSYDQSFWDQLEAIAMQRMGYGNLVVNPTNPNAGRYRPNGRIQVLDDQATATVGANSIIPLVDAKIVCNTRWRTDYAYTDVNGYFSTSKTYIIKCRYRIKWESTNHTRKFDIRSGFYGQAWTLLQNYSFNACNKVLDRNFGVNYLPGIRGIDTYYAWTFIAANDVLNNDPNGIIKPGYRIKISALNKNNDELLGLTAHITRIVGGPDVRIWRYTNNIETSSLSTYFVTIHELGHLIHRAGAGATAMVFSSSLLRESYSDAIAWWFCMNRWYPVRIYATNYNNVGFINDRLPVSIFTTTGQMPLVNWNFNMADNYSAVFVDLMDNVTNNTQYSNGGGDLPTGAFNDNVGGYTLKQIENAVIDASGQVQEENNLNKINLYLVNNYNNLTENFIIDYFDLYFDNLR
jgi:hypothetical protein